MRAWVVALLVALTAMAGCVEQAEPETTEPTCDGSECADAPVDSDPEQEEPAEEPADEEPVQWAATLESDVTEGEAPFDVLFTFHLEGGELNEFHTWTLDVNGDGTPETEGDGNSLPGNYTHTFADAGEYTALFEATDGIDAWNATVVIIATAPPAQEETEEEPVEEPVDEGPSFPLVIDAYVDAANPSFYEGAEFGPHLFCDGWSTSSGLVGGSCFWIEVDPSWVGRTFTTAGPGDIDVWIGSECASQTAIATHVGGEIGHDSGTIPEGSGCFVAANYEGDGDFTITIL